jgi:hypothetical protein
VGDVGRSVYAILQQSQNVICGNVSYQRIFLGLPENNVREKRTPDSLSQQMNLLPQPDIISTFILNVRPSGI